MTADYFQDITPPDDSEPTPRRKRIDDDEVDVPAHERKGSAPEDDEVAVPIRVKDSPSRGIRNIAPPRPRPAVRAGRVADVRGIPHRPRRRRSPVFIWIAAGAALVVLAAIALLTLRSTSITVTPKTRAVTFDPSSQLIAYPANSALPGALTYTEKALDLEDSEVVAAQGTEHVDTKASGSMTIHNETATPAKFVKNTRFQTPDGLIFRAPADVSIAAKSTVAITVVADQPGPAYNIGPVTRFTVPGLKSNAQMYAHVYGSSDADMTGGFSGDRPAAAPGALETALAAVRTRLEAKARAALPSNDGMAFPDSVKISYQDEANTQEATGGFRIHEKAHVEIPIFSADSLGAAIAAAVSAETNGSTIVFRPGKNFTAKLVNTTAQFGSDPITLTPSGSGTLVWGVDSTALANALLGKDQASFQTIVNGFPSIQEAHARIEPFWTKKFPARASDIKVKVVEPQSLN